LPASSHDRDGGKGDNTMNIVTKAIDQTEQLLGHSPHPAIVMLPLGAFVVSNIADGLAMATGDCRYDGTAEVSMAIGLASSVVAGATGLRDYAFIPSDRQPNHQIATKHAIGNMLVGGLFTASYLMRRGERLRGEQPCLTSRLLGLAGGVLGLYTSWLGGRLVEELGEGVQPVHARLEEHSHAHIY
jgi:uncharacterized membrane protein